MWFGTHDGLNRYDGENSVTDCHIPGDSTSLGDNYVWSLLCQGDTGIWVGTNRGLFFYDYKHDDFHKISISNEAGAESFINARCMLLDDEWLYVAGNRGLLRYHVAKRQFVPFQMPSAYAETGDIIDMHKDEQGNIWLAGQDGLMQLRDNEVEVIEFALAGYPDIQPYGRSLETDGLGRIWMATENFELGLIIYEPSTGVQQILTEENSLLPYNQVRTLQRFEDGNIWVGTREGLAIVN
jgi:ligand-binding sensor domain-containing protein